MKRFFFKKAMNGQRDEKPFFSSKAVMVAVGIAVLFMLINSRLFTSGISSEDKKNESPEMSDTETAYDTLDTSDTEKRLEEILEKLDGAGEVSVMIYYSNTGERIVASDSKTRSEQETRGEEMNAVSEDKEKSTVLYGGSGNERPFVTEERLPKPSGVLVIAEGAENEKVRYEISEAVRALLGLMPNRIKVSARAKA